MSSPKTLEEEAEIIRKIDEQLKNVSPDVKREAFQILASRHLGIAAAGKPAPTMTAPATSTAEKVARTRKPKSSNFTIVKDLNLRGKDGKPSLRDFYKQKQPRGFLETNAVFVYFMCQKMELKAITPNHVYTCYKEVGARIPGAFYQSLLDTARTKGFIDTQDTADIRITTVGENFVEHDLPPATAKSPEKEKH